MWNSIKGLPLWRCCKLNSTHHGKLRRYSRLYCGSFFIPHVLRLVYCGSYVYGCFGRSTQGIKEYLVYCGASCTAAALQLALMRRNLSPFISSRKMFGWDLMCFDCVEFVTVPIYQFDSVILCPAIGFVTITLKDRHEELIIWIIDEC